MPCACCWSVLETTTIFKRDSDNQIFLNEDVLLNGIELMGLLNEALEGQLLFKERGISGGWRSGPKTLDM